LPLDRILAAVAELASSRMRANPALSMIVSLSIMVWVSGPGPAEKFLPGAADPAPP
jgi:hypothetical protein